MIGHLRKDCMERDEDTVDDDDDDGNWRYGPWLRASPKRSGVTMGNRSEGVVNYRRMPLFSDESPSPKGAAEELCGDNKKVLNPSVAKGGQGAMVNDIVDSFSNCHLDESRVKGKGAVNDNLIALNWGNDDADKGGEGVIEVDGPAKKESNVKGIGPVEEPKMNAAGEGKGFVFTSSTRFEEGTGSKVQPKGWKRRARQRGTSHQSKEESTQKRKLSDDVMLLGAGREDEIGGGKKFAFNVEAEVALQPRQDQ
ncbi:hypothetical protein RIF29_04659 [Crotalaria pallida]|uniref:Uncharacterized protein n=1 Tax=Crotalaria pallida TaxID=3830 RepID=A0AAN9P9D9_CROPI